MPFWEFEFKQSKGGQKDYPKETFPVSARPSFHLFPGILNNPLELTNLARSLQALYMQSKLYLYQIDERIEALADQNRPFSPDWASLKKEGKAIARELAEEEEKVGPYFLIGYSFGCSQAVLAAQQLAKTGQDVFVYLIDGPSPEYSSHYFTFRSPSAILDLQNIINYAAELSGLQQVTLNAPQISCLQNLSLDECIEYIGSLVINNETDADEDNLILFKARVELAKQRLFNLAQHTCKPLLHESGKITIRTFFTDKTAEKYGIQNGSHAGWAPYAHVISATDNAALAAQTHSALLQDGSNASMIAREVETFVTQSVTADFLTDEYNADRALKRKLNQAARRLNLLAKEVEEISKQAKNPETREAANKLVRKISPSDSPNSAHFSGSLMTAPSVAARNAPDKDKGEQTQGNRLSLAISIPLPTVPAVSSVGSLSCSPGSDESSCRLDSKDTNSIVSSADISREPSPSPRQQDRWGSPARNRVSNSSAVLFSHQTAGSPEDSSAKQSENNSCSVRA